MEAKGDDVEYYSVFSPPGEIFPSNNVFVMIDEKTFCNIYKVIGFVFKEYAQFKNDKQWDEVNPKKVEALRNYMKHN